MMKKTLTFIFYIVMALGITGCETNKNEFDIGEKSNIEIIESEVSFFVEEETLMNTGGTFILKNNSDKTFEYGNPYEMEIKEGNEWHKINVELNFSLPSFQLDTGESKEIEINWENGYGKLSPGEYRIIKDINFEKEEGTYETFFVAAEFTIK